jgi:uncharacterized protein (DUF427 family)
VTLTVGTGPFGHRPGGAFNFDVPRREDLLYLDSSAKRIRGTAGGETVVDAHHPRVLYEHGRLPIFYFQRDEVRTDLLEPAGESEGTASKGPERRFDLRLPDGERKDAAWEHFQPPAEIAALSGLVAFEWDAMDRWLEEDEEMIVHLRDPYHRIDILDTSRHVEVKVAGQTVADSDRALVLFETSLPPRWYLPKEDVEGDLLVPSDTRTGCAYKGFASYWSVKAGETFEDDLVWSYPDPRPEAARIKDRLAFFNERVDLRLDGELQERPVTPWSRR